MWGLIILLHKECLEDLSVWLCSNSWDSLLPMIPAECRTKSNYKVTEAVTL